MPKQYKSARGRTVDMGAFVSQNENTRAIGNMNVNARGDELDSTNHPIRSRQQTVQRHYKAQVTQEVAAAPRQAAVAELKEDPVIFPDDISDNEDQAWEPLPEVAKVAEVEVKEKKPSGLAQAMARAREVKKNG